MIRLGVIADDFTGACDVGIQFKKYGLKTVVFAGIEARDPVSDFEMVVIDTESRNDAADIAYGKVKDAAKALRRMDIRLVYKKIDSTLRGNIGRELEAILDELKFKAIIVAPAFPATNRTTVNGRQLINGVPLERTEFAYDPLNPVSESRVPTLIKRQTQIGAGTIDLPKVREGTESLKQKIQAMMEEGFKILVVDAECEDDLNAIAKAALDSELLPCGSAGLAEWVSNWLAVGPREQRFLIVSGSVNTVTLDQISAAEESLNVSVVQPNLFEVLMGGENRRTEQNRLVKEASKSLTEGKGVILRLAKSKDEVSLLQEYGRNLGMDFREICEKILSSLGETSSEIMEDSRIIGLILVGGDTAINVTKSIGALGIRIEEEVLPGIPLGRIVGGPFNGLLAVTKAGGFGRRNALVEAARKLVEKHLAEKG